MLGFGGFCGFFGWGGFLVCAFAVLILFSRGGLYEFLCFCVWYLVVLAVWAVAMMFGFGVGHLLVMFGVGGGFSLARGGFPGFLMYLLF